jgi:hypothetical protein
LCLGGVSGYAEAGPSKRGGRAVLGLWGELGGGLCGLGQWGWLWGVGVDEVGWVLRWGGRGGARLGRVVVSSVRRQGVRRVVGEVYDDGGSGWCKQGWWIWYIG